MIKKPVKKTGRKTTKKPTKKRRFVETSGIVQIRRPLEIRLKLSPSGARSLRTTLGNALAAGSHFSSAQIQLDAADLNSIYLYLGAAQTKNFAARLAALELSEPEALSRSGKRRRQ